MRYVCVLFLLAACSTTTSKKTTTVEQKPPVHNVSVNEATVAVDPSVTCVTLRISQYPTITFVEYLETNREESFLNFDEAMKTVQILVDKCPQTEVRLSNPELSSRFSPQTNLSAITPEPFIYRTAAQVPDQFRKHIATNLDFEKQMVIVVEGPAGLSTVDCLDERLGLRSQKAVKTYEKRKRDRLKLATTTNPTEAVIYNPFVLVSMNLQGMIVNTARVNENCRSTYYFRRPTLLVLPQSGRRILLTPPYTWLPALPPAPVSP